MSYLSRELVAMATKPSSTVSSSQPINIEADDSGIIVSSKQDPSAPSVISSPAHSTVTPPTLPAESEVSTVSSSLVFQGFSTLWVQLLVSKFVLNVYNRQTASSNCTNPVGRAAAADGEPSSDKLHVEGKLSSGSEVSLETVRVSLEADGISLQVDIQERCTDIVFKVASTECSYLKKSCQDPSGISWLPYLSGLNGKLFSTTSTSLPEELSRITDPLSHPFVPFEHVASSDSPSSVSYLLSPQHHQVSPKLQPNFFQTKVKIPQCQPQKTVKVSISVKPFEVVAWLPLLDTVLEIFSAGTEGSQLQHDVGKVQSVDGGGGGRGVAAWPSLEVNIEPFRVVFPNVNHTHFLLLGVGGVSVTSSMEYAGPDVRYITNSSAFRRLSLLSSERRQPALPAYQLEAISVSMWGVHNSTTRYMHLLTSCVYR